MRAVSRGGFARKSKCDQRLGRSTVGNGVADEFLHDTMQPASKLCLRRMAVGNAFAQCFDCTSCNCRSRIGHELVSLTLRHIGSEVDWCEGDETHPVRLLAAG